MVLFSPSCNPPKLAVMKIAPVPDVTLTFPVPAPRLTSPVAALMSIAGPISTISPNVYNWILPTPVTTENKPAPIPKDTPPPAAKKFIPHAFGKIGF